MTRLTIITTPHNTILHLPFSLSATTGELRLALGALIDGQAGRMVCGGRVLQEDRTLAEQGKQQPLEQWC